MKTLGIIGGIGPESTVEYYRLIGANEMKAVTDYLVGEVNKLSKAGADFGLFAANTPHIVFQEIYERARMPLISIVEAACDAALARKLSRLGLFGTRFTMQGSFYPDVFSRWGLQLVMPAEADQDYIHDKYMHELVHGEYPEETRRRLLEIADHLIDQQHIDGLILGGTMRLAHAVR